MTTATGHQADASRQSSELGTEMLLEMLGRMMLIRRFEERTMQSYMQQKIGGFCHIYIGQEALAVGSLAAIRGDDPIITAYRDHGHALARGMHPNYCMAEMFGRVTGCAKGKGGSMHMFDRPHHMYGGHAIVGGQIPIGVGLAFAIQYKGEDKIAVCYLGDGALNQGAFHESMNLSAIWALPILFVLENNAYSMGTHIARGTSAADDLGAKAAAYGMRYAACDGKDVLATYDCIRRESDLTRGGAGPCFINAETYRYKGHSMSDPQKYRTTEQVTAEQEQDCINRLVNTLVKRGRATQEQIDRIDKAAKKAASDAVKFANDSPDPPLEQLYTDVYAQPFGPYRDGEPPAMLRES